jgi:hypothetical protein
VTTDASADQYESHPTTQEPWHSWGDTVRYVIFRLAQIMPTAMLVWQLYLHR